MYCYLDCPQGFAIGFNTLWKHKSNNKGKSYFMTPVWPIHGGQEVKLTGYLDCPHMVSQYLLIHSEAIIATMKEISGKNSKTAIFPPVWPIRGGWGWGGKTDRLLRLSTYAFPILLNTFSIYKSNIKGDIRQKLEISYFMTPVWPMGGEEGSGDKSDQLFRFSTYAFPIPLNTFWSYKSNDKGDIRQKLKIGYFMTPVWPIRGGRGVKLTGYLDSPHMLSQYLLIHSEAIKATIKEI